MEDYTSAGIILLTGDYTLVVQGVTTGKWSFPKGHKEEGETAKITAMREMKEETGVVLTPDDKYCATYSYKYNYGDGERTYVYFIYKTKRQIIPSVCDPAEIKCVKWVHLAQLANDDHYNKNRSLSDYVRAQIKRKASQICAFGDECRNGKKCLYKHE